MTREFYGCTTDAQRSINVLLSLPATGKEQDWEFELADPNRIGEMLQASATQNLNYDERCALSLLLIASMEERSAAGNLEGDLIRKAHMLFNNNAELRAAMMFYWIELHRSSDDELMRKILLG
ncbi:MULTISPECIES: hypothetical protein [Mesorhizobium]|uniref:hypothetical protein n=1 Tax=Mesorhizobium sp. TaxID=1871066 RepID=UPI00049418C2|nr:MULTISPECIES: hypothetical protein [Mesorhizobium]RWM67491.1 MAG: hypothetical protein EOR82_26785 [Mesorhizobium sp.]TIO21965.1 MAG: hypothetical protein E5X83_27480 [Mesorhizobium sp.]TJV56937.1 MAG: hypothetical protein E5X82_22830 [Mesorhizobium sp.]